MSLILDALNRSRQDQDPVPGLSSEHYADKPASTRRFLPWAALAIALLFIAWLLFGGEKDEVAGQGVVSPVAKLSQNIGSAATSVTDELKSRAEAAREKTRAQTPAAVPAAQPVAPAVQPVAPAATMALSAEDTPATKTAAQASAASPGTADADRAALEALYALSRQQGANKPAQAKPRQPVSPASAKAAEPVASKEEPVDVEQVLRKAQEDMANAQLVEHSAPFLVNLSQQVKNDIPSILYQRHDYSSVGGQSRVVLNGKTMGVGGSPVTGMRVDEILQDSVVLTYRGTQFRLRALNSWVNL